MKKFFILLLIVFLSLSGTNSFSQEMTEAEMQQSISLQTGLIYGHDFTFGIRFYMDYQRQWKENWFWGVSLESNKILQYQLGESGYDPDDFLGLLSLNAIYRIQPGRMNIHWNALAGIGGIYYKWSENSRLGLHINLGLTLEIPVSENVNFVTSPLIILFPPSRLYIAPFFPYYQYHVKVLSILPLGLRFDF